ncbi:hypothetical protein [Algicola sagamiensis]|uniref:hypothetical protein n=1 Tax=Algicola sagamiensis TaxID=163869 RepID=UPI00035F8EBA|nr:hypothetical protein [Algicola sagamiensis]
MKNLILSIIPLLTILSGCKSTADHRADIRDDSGDRISVGKVQREIREGMTTADVIQILGSPNIVSTDEERREVWVYDKVSTDSAYSTSSGGISALILGFGPKAAGGLGGGYNASTGAASTSQRTLTIIIKFDKDSRVRDFAYHQSKF